MSDPTIDYQIAEFAEIIRQFRRLRRFMKPMLPAHVALAEARFEKLFSKDRSLNPADVDVLYNIGMILSDQQEPMTMGELSQALDVPLSSATRIVDLLVKNDYAQRLPDANDRRIVRVALTEAGQAMYQVVDEFIRERVDHVMRHFSAAERDSLITLMRKLMTVLEEEFQHI